MIIKATPAIGLRDATFELSEISRIIPAAATPYCRMLTILIRDLTSVFRGIAVVRWSTISTGVSGEPM